MCEVTTSRCPECAKRGKDTRGDNLNTYSDTGWSVCHACNYRKGPDGSSPPPKERKVKTLGGAKPLSQTDNRGEINDLRSRGIYEDTCRKYGYLSDDNIHLAPFHDENGNLVARKVRNEKTKNFVWYGEPSEAVLFGQHLFNRGQRRVIVTEGEIDCLSVYQTIAASTKSEWAVVSVKNGASDDDKATKVVKEVRRSFDWLNSFEEVVFCFDDDEPGQKSAQACAKLFAPGKAHITALRYKDPNEYLKNNDRKNLTKDLWNSPKYVPQGVVQLKDLTGAFKINKALPYTSPEITAKMLGRKIGTMTGLLSGTGSGKTTLIFDQMIEDMNSNIKTGAIILEATPDETLLDLAGLVMRKPVRSILIQRELQKIDPRIRPEFVDDLDDEELQHTIEELKGNENLCLFDHFGQAKEDEIIEKIEYFVSGMGCEEIILDHMNSVETNEPGAMGLEAFAKRIQRMTKRLPAHFTIVSQLSQTGGKSWEEGEVPSLRDMRGTQNVPGCFDEIMSLTRNQQAETEEERNTVFIHSLKGRLSSFTGLIETRQYNRNTGRFDIPSAAQDAFQVETLS